MIQSKRTVPTILATVALLAAACDRPDEPLSPSVPQNVQLSLAAAGQNPDQHALGRAIPAFGGLFVAADGTPTVFLTDPAARGAVATALAGFLAEHGSTAAQLRVLPSRFSYSQLESFFDQVRPDVFAGPGTVFMDLDETRNQIVIGVEHATAASRVSTFVAALGLPAGAVAVESADPVHPVLTLRDRFADVPAGVQIHFGNYLCSIGIIASVGGQAHFVTASHCTNAQGGVEGTLYYQPVSSVDGTAIGTEVADPAYYDRRQGDCPYAGAKCRYSDAALVASTGARPYLLGSIARTALNSLTWTNDYFTVTGKATGNGIVGTARGKVGRTTGYTTGTISRSCVDTGVQGSNKVLLCQDFVTGPGTIVGSGDSGSGVFAGSSNVTWWGILWGSSGASDYVYSPASNVEQELGSLAVAAGGGGGGGGGDPTLTASFTYSCHFGDCTFDASSSTAATSYSWSFGDGGTAQGVMASHTFANPQDYAVVLTASDGTGSATSTQTISCQTRGKNLQCR